ncbi:MAG TPA: GNAT family N-acetyltransferase, partial [Bacteroidia bacterium]|nr:GNAT family N-acetyltransferase [Bacteroidia bacterium]
METVFTITEDKTRFDIDFIHAELAKSYWAKGIPKKIVQRGIENSLCFGIYSGEQQIGFARVITDKATFAYLCDVIVTESFRGRGAGKQLMTYIMAHPDLRGLRRFTLGTQDAHELYRKYGFTAPQFPDRQMEINRR